jgi:hypothetical protein
MGNPTNRSLRYRARNNRDVPNSHEKPIAPVHYP